MSILNHIVSSKGDVFHFQGKKVEDMSKFFVESRISKHVIRNIPEVSNYSSILRYVNDTLSYIYRVNSERVSLTEKNKGGTYPSSSFTVTTNLEVVGEYENIEQKKKEFFTIKKSSQFLMQCLIEAGKGSTYFKLESIDKVKDKDKFPKIPKKEIEEKGSYAKALFSILDEDIALNECREFPKGWFWITYNPFTVQLKNEKFELNSTHRVRYLSYITKYIENVSNLSSNPDFSLEERQGLIQRYELFLFEILEEYFDIEDIKLI